MKKSEKKGINQKTQTCAHICMYTYLKMRDSCKLMELLEIIATP